MDDDIFRQLGLSRHQSGAYEYLLKNGPSAPPKIANSLKLTRSNAYKVLDSLVELGLISRSEVDKKLVYKAEDPIAIGSLVAEERNRVIALEHNIKVGLKDLRKLYRRTASDSSALTYKGSTAIKGLYVHQAEMKQPIYFIQGLQDRLSMGYEAMNSIRFLASKHGTQRYGITPDIPEAPVNPELDKKTNLHRTWLPEKSYRSPVEWNVCGDELVIINFEEPQTGIRIKDAAIADSFKQLWSAFDENLRANPSYKKLP
ncbi:MAG TPA: helix-turn-helix domain-containing protein, partial [Candidatus Babeliales bacterium]|nr:helix-turn-helix domain-containing protein [Candidatus Babeliales bacterium]